MKKILPMLLILLFFIVSTGTPAQNSAAEQQTESDDRASQSVPSSQDKGKSKRPIWPHPFHPSETISADAVVTLPADI